MNSAQKNRESIELFLKAMYDFDELAVRSFIQNIFSQEVKIQMCHPFGDVLKNEFLVFEEGPSESFTLQWATFQDASDQTSLSRIWGGIHPPIDDIKGRIIGEKIGKESFDLAQQYFSGTLGNITILSNKNSTKVYPNPMLNTLHIRTNYLDEIKLELYSLSGKILFSTNKVNHSGSVDLKLDYLAKGVYILKGVSNNNSLVFQRKIIK